MTDMTFRRWRLPLLIAGLLMAFQIAILGIAISGTPPGYRWLGSTVFNTSDAAVYLNYLAQGRNSLVHFNLFSDNAQIPRFDLFWSIGGLLVRAGLPPIAAHEALRFMCTLALAFSLAATARSVTSDESKACLAAFLMMGGLSIGWLLAVLQGMTQNRNIMIDAPADLMSEIAIAPVSIGGAHMILSLALQLLAMRWIWEAMEEEKTKRLIAVCAVLFSLAWFHPYFIPLFGLVSIFALLKDRIANGFFRRTTVKTFALLNSSMVPGATYIVWTMLRDDGFRTQQFDRNVLALDPLYLWILPVLPLIFAMVWLIKKGITPGHTWTKRPDWVIAWIIAASICIFLPFPWKRKYTQGLLPAFVMITLPFWLLSADWIGKNLYRPIRWLVGLTLLFPFVMLLRTQAIAPFSPRYLSNFYAPSAQFRAWEAISRLPENSRIIATSLPDNVWTPAYTAHSVWLGHAHETPDFSNRRRQFDSWLHSTSTDAFNRFLDVNGIDTVLSVTATDTRRCVASLELPWHNIFSENDVSVWTKKVYAEK